MSKHYVFPLNGTEILLSVKSGTNPRTGQANFLALLPNPIGGNDEGRTALATCQAEAAEETYNKVTINAISNTFYRGTHNHVDLDFHVSSNYGYDAAAALTATQNRDIALANNEWQYSFYKASENNHRRHDRDRCAYCAYLDLRHPGLTLLHAGQCCRGERPSCTGSSGPA